MVIRHEGATGVPGAFVFSLFAHLQAPHLVSVNQQVTQGAQIGWAGTSGESTGIHLHYEARVDMVAGQIFTGSGIPSLAVPGNWWYACYSPPIPSTGFYAECSVNDGVAEFPVKSTPPPGASQSTRHLANTQSPADNPSAYSGPVISNQNTIHRGGSPSTPGTGYETSFQTQYYSNGCGCWLVISTDTNPTLNVGLFSGQTNSHVVFAWNSVSGWSPGQLRPLSPTRFPHRRASDSFMVRAGRGLGRGRGVPGRQVHLVERLAGSLGWRNLGAVTDVRRSGELHPRP